MMKTPQQMAEDIVAREGGYNEVSGDRGGATNHGVSLRYAKGIGLDMDGDGDTDKDDIRLVTPDVAVKLYLEDFLVEPRISALPTELQPQLFDWAVNSGPSRPVMALQRLLGFKGNDVDGRIGPMTRRAAETEVQGNGWQGLNDAVVELRKRFYNDIVAEDPSQAKFLKGWTNRANEFYSSAS